MGVHVLRTVEPDDDLDDLGVFEEIVGDASVWSFGEATHGAHEFLALRNRLFRFAVERLGFTAIAVESHHGDAALADDFVLGRRGEPTYDTVQAAFSANTSFGWTRDPFGENLELLRWMRSYNAREGARRPLRFYGLDVGWSSGSPPEWSGSAEVSAALELVTAMDAGLGARLGAAVEPYLARFDSEHDDTLSPPEKSALRQALDAIVTTFETHALPWVEQGSDGFFRAARHAEIACLLAADGEPSTSPSGVDAPSGVRDRVMADSVRWILDRERSEGRIFVFASDGHVQRGPRSYPEAGWREYLSMGQRLDTTLGGAMVVVGSVHDRGTHAGVGGATIDAPPADAASISGVLAQVGAPLFVADLRTTSPVGESIVALDASLPVHSAAEPDDPRLVASASFDAVVFVDRVSPVVPIEIADIGSAEMDDVSAARPLSDRTR